VHMLLACEDTKCHSYHVMTVDRGATGCDGCSSHAKTENAGATGGEDGMRALLACKYTSNSCAAEV